MNVEPRAAARSTGLSFLRDKRGLSTLEYAVLFVVLLIGGLALWKALAGSMSKNVGAATDEFSSVLGGSQPSWQTPVGTYSSTNHDAPGAGGMIPGRPAMAAGSLPAASSAASPSKQDTTQQPPAQQAHERGLWDSAKAFVRESANSQLALGIAAGTAGSIVWPLGFVPSPEGAGRNFEAGRAIGETATGIAQIYGGAAAILGGTAGGGASLAAAVPSGGTSLAGLIPSGAAVNAGVVMAGVGLSNVVRGLWRGYNAMQMADDSAAGGGSSNGSNGNPSGTRNAITPGNAPSTTTASATSASRAATKAINLPAWRKVGVDMAHILERHVPGAKYSAGRTVFPSTMNEKGITRAIREAYESSTKVGVQGADRVLLQGQGRGLTIEMWFNKATNTIETAYPVTP